MRNLYIESDGTGHGTNVYAANGQRIEGVQKVSWEVEVGGLATALIKVRRVRVAVVAKDADIEEHIIRGTE